MKQLHLYQKEAYIWGLASTIIASAFIVSRNNHNNLIALNLYKNQKNRN